MFRNEKKKSSARLGLLAFTFVLTVSMLFSTGGMALAADQDGGQQSASSQTEKAQTSDSSASADSSSAQKSEKAATVKKGATTKGISEEVDTFAELQTAVTYANYGTTDTIVIAKDITVTATLEFTAGTVTVKGKTGSEKLINSSTNPVTMMSITGTANVTFKDITVDGNHQAKSLIFTSGSAIIDIGDGATFENSGSAGKPDSGTAADAGIQSEYTNNNIHITVSKGGEVKNNYGEYSGGILLIGDNARLDVYGKITGNVDNGSQQNGGGIMTWNSTVVLHDDCVISGNKANFSGDSGSGGGINVSYTSNYGSKPGKLIMYGGTIKDNEADCEANGETKPFAKDAGGGVAVCRGVFVMYGGTITGNKASFGGGVSVNNEGSAHDFAGYFIGIGGNISGNTAWAKETILKDKASGSASGATGKEETVPIHSQGPDLSAQAWGKVSITSGLKIGTAGKQITALPFKADINVEAKSYPGGTALELRNVHEKYVARDDTYDSDNKVYNAKALEEEKDLRTAYDSLKTTTLKDYYQIGFHSTDKVDYRVGRETRFFMALTDANNFVTDKNDETKIISYMNECNNAITGHNTTNCLPKSSSQGPVTIKIDYPDYTAASTHDYKVLYIPYDKVYGTAKEAQVLTPTEKSDGLYLTYNGSDGNPATGTGELYGVFEIEKKPKPATVKFDANGGSGTMSNQTITSVLDADNTAIDANKVTGTALNKNTFTAPGKYYKFSGWSTKPYGLDGITTTPGTGKDYADQEVIRPNAGDAITLYAKWEAIATPLGDPAKVTFYGNYTGSSPASYDQSVPAGESTALMANQYARSGYTITGWNTKADGTGTKYSLGQAVKLGAKQQLDLYAVWQKDLTPAYVLLPRAIAKGKTKQVVTWTKVGDADGYYIYFGHCAHKYKKVKTIKGNSTFKWTKGKLKKGKKYKYYVAAYKVINGKKKIIKRSVTVHSIAGNKVRKITNTKTIKASRKTATIAVGKTVKIKATVKGVNKGKKVMSKDHAPKVRYISGDKRVASVNKKGVITGKRFGTVKIYVLAVNGVRTYVNVTVK
ncbi:MAG: InlB B-repeat-containing protein [Eubacteriaceae bacterium]|nr:InlB B-repeat-containing protein [Eubacteriaceae bacterium]